MLKYNLKDLMTVELRNGKCYLVIGDKLMNFEDSIPLDLYGATMFHETTRKCDIMKVYGTKFSRLPKPEEIEGKVGCALWERPKDEPYNGKALFTGYNQGSTPGYTVGRVYTFTDGKTVDDRGNVRPYSEKLTVNTLVPFGFFEIVE